MNAAAEAERAPNGLAKARGSSNSELKETLGLTRLLIAQVEAYRSVRPMNDTQRRAANRIEEALIEALRQACEQLGPSRTGDTDFAADIGREITRLEHQIADRKAALAA